MSKLPKTLLKFAAPLAAKNPSAFPDEDAAVRHLTDSYTRLKKNDDVQSICSGGYLMRKDGEGYIELFVIASLALDVDGVWWAE